MSNLKGWGLIKIADKNSVTHVSHKCTSNLGTSSRGCFFKNTFLKILQNFKGKHLCWSLFFNKVALKKETPTQVFSCKFCKYFNNTFLREHFRGTASQTFCTGIQDSIYQNDGEYTCLIWLKQNCIINNPNLGGLRENLINLTHFIGYLKWNKRSPVFERHNIPLITEQPPEVFCKKRCS